MKTAISLPAETYSRAESARKRIGASRSELYTRALEDFLKAMEVREMERQYEEGYRKKPMTKEEMRVLKAFSRATARVWAKELPW